MTDPFANIIGVTQGLNVELGLHSKFFMNSGAFNHKISLSLL
jgi:hypothetical protein